jgi:hypothetical protein
MTLLMSESGTCRLGQISECPAAISGHWSLIIGTFGSELCHVLAGDLQRLAAEARGDVIGTADRHRNRRRQTQALGQRFHRLVPEITTAATSSRWCERE